MDIIFPARIACKNGTEIDAVEHAGDLTWRAGERSGIKTAMRRRDRRQARQALRAAR